MTWTEAKQEAGKILGSLRERYDLREIRLVIRALGREYFRLKDADVRKRSETTQTERKEGESNHEREN